MVGRSTRFNMLYVQSGPKKYAVVLRVVTSSRMDQFKEISLLESLLNFHKDARNICHIPLKCYHFTLQNGKQRNDASGSFANHRVKHSDRHVHRIDNCIEQ